MSLASLGFRGIVEYQSMNKLMAGSAQSYQVRQSFPIFPDVSLVMDFGRGSMPAALADPVTAFQDLAALRGPAWREEIAVILDTFIHGPLETGRPCPGIKAGLIFFVRRGHSLDHHADPIGEIAD